MGDFKRSSPAAESFARALETKTAKAEVPSPQLDDINAPDKGWVTRSKNNPLGENYEVGVVDKAPSSADLREKFGDYGTTEQRKRVAEVQQAERDRMTPEEKDKQEEEQHNLIRNVALNRQKEWDESPQGKASGDPNDPRRPKDPGEYVSKLKTPETETPGLTPEEQRKGKFLKRFSDSL
jgi:hypothetical protein